LSGRKMPFWACIPLRRPLRDANVSLLRKKSEESKISSEGIFQQPVRGAIRIRTLVRGRGRYAAHRSFQVSDPTAPVGT